MSKTNPNHSHHNCITQLNHHFMLAKHQSLIRNPSAQAMPILKGIRFKPAKLSIFPASTHQAKQENMPEAQQMARILKGLYINLLSHRKTPACPYQ
jgi:hypothetical protein